MCEETQPFTASASSREIALPISALSSDRPTARFDLDDDLLGMAPIVVEDCLQPASSILLADWMLAVRPRCWCDHEPASEPVQRPRDESRVVPALNHHQVVGVGGGQPKKDAPGPTDRSDHSALLPANYFEVSCRGKIVC
jgi:hypothetical protein